MSCGAGGVQKSAARIDQLAGLGQILIGFELLFAAANVWLQKTASEMLEREAVRPSKGYAQLLIERGIDPTFSKVMAQMILKHAERVSAECPRYPEVTKAIRYLSGERVRKDAVSRRVKLLLRAWKETSIIETIFEAAGMREFEFIGLLEAVSDGHLESVSPLRQIACTIVPHLPCRRGPRLKEQSAAHEFFLEHLPPNGRNHLYTRVTDSREFSDPLTWATRREFDDPRFTPVAAVSRLKARKAQ
jgi:hypothetical protein